MEGVLVRKESKNYLQSNPMTRLSMMMLFYLDNTAAWHRSSSQNIFQCCLEHSLQLLKAKMLLIMIYNVTI